MMHMHRRAGPGRDALDPVGEAPTCIAGLHDNRSRQIEGVIAGAFTSAPNGCSFSRTHVHQPALFQASDI
jgi:hypothetical protein